jgi:DnaD/phage-associated family protein
MPNRILKDSICTSPNVDRLSRDAEVFFYRLIVQCDDFGRMDARLPILRAKCYPLQIDRVSEDDIAAWLNELETAKLVTVYSVGDQDYLQMCTWDKHQQVRAKRSKYPSLQDRDSNGNHLIADDSICPRNPIQSESNPSVTPPADNLEVQDQMVAQWRAILGDTLTPAMFPEVKQYMDKLQTRGIVEWWLLALKETTKANRPSWQYMKAVLETWLAAGAPSVAKNGTDPAKRPGVAPLKSATEQAEADARQLEYEAQIAAQLARMATQ